MNLENIKTVLENMPSDWLRLTTHRLDIYNESLAKVEFLEKLEGLIKENNVNKESLKALPTAFDYIRLGHPLSCVLEWVVASKMNLKGDNAIVFSSQSMPILAVLRRNLLDGVKTQIVPEGELPDNFDVEALKTVYGYNFEVNSKRSDFDGATIVVTDLNSALEYKLESGVDFVVGLDRELGSITIVNTEKDTHYVKEIQHVRRRESIAMTPHDCLYVLEKLIGMPQTDPSVSSVARAKTLSSIKEVTSSTGDAVLGSCGLSIQYAIMMGLVDESLKNNPGKDIKFIVPPNCYGGTNDQARRVAACVENVEILDLPVDSGSDMVSSVERILGEVAKMDAIPFIIAEIPTNPRVEVPDLIRLREVLLNTNSIAPVFILDQTFCPNVKFLGKGAYLDGVKTLSYVSGSKFPSGGICTAGYVVANEEASSLLPFVEKHLRICGNEATAFQIETLAEHMPTMNERIAGAYKNTRAFVTHIENVLPSAKINFVSEELASNEFTPSVFSLDLPTIGESHDEREAYKRELNHKLISLMIKEIPSEAKHCVSYGQLAGSYWTIPATSTQGTTKEGDKDYIVRISLAPKFDLKKHNEVFSRFVKEYIK